MTIKTIARAVDLETAEYLDKMIIQLNETIADTVPWAKNDYEDGFLDAAEQVTQFIRQCAGYLRGNHGPLG